MFVWFYNQINMKSLYSADVDMSMPAKKEVYLFLDKPVKSEKRYIHSIGEWETCQKRYFGLFFFWY